MSSAFPGPSPSFLTSHLFIPQLKFFRGQACAAVVGVKAKLMECLSPEFTSNGILGKAQETWKETSIA